MLRRSLVCPLIVALGFFLIACSAAMAATYWAADGPTTPPAENTRIERPEAVSLRGPWRVMAISARNADGEHVAFDDPSQYAHAGRPCYVLIGKTTFILRIRDQALLDATYALDRAKTPAAIDLKTKDGDMLGIFREIDNITEIFLNDDGDGRPTDFDRAKCAVYLSIRRFPNRNVYVCDRDGTNPRRLAAETVFVRCYRQSWSSDGRKIALQGTPREFDKDGDLSRVFVIDLESGKARDLGPGAAPSWSPDGKLLAFHTAERLFEQVPYSLQVLPRWETSHVWVVSADGGDARDLGLGSSPAWSPDGKWIAACDAAKNETFIISPDGSNRKSLGLGAGHFAWSPDAENLAYAIGANVGIYNLKTEKLRLLLDDRYGVIRGCLAWSPDGRRIAFLARDPRMACELAMVDAEGHEKGFRTLLSQDGDGNRFTDSVSWDRDGSRILTGLHPDRGDRWLLCLVDPEGKLPVQPLEGQNHDADHIAPVFSPDCSKIVWTEVVASSP
ncbi:MAG: hypothetical protein GX594_09455 [Pirellulaceae bacterium]|nr:hypothetical protein [Pirellulaceae bacterium]